MLKRDIVRELEKGRRLREVAVMFRVPYPFVRVLASESGIDYVGRQLDPKQEKEIRRRRDELGQSIREIGREMGLPKSKVGRFFRRVYLDVMADEDEIGFEDAGPRRCPVHGNGRPGPMTTSNAPTETLRYSQSVRELVAEAAGRKHDPRPVPQPAGVRKTHRRGAFQS